MGLDRLMLNVAAAAAVLAAGCDDGAGRPARLLDGRPAAHFRPVPDSVVGAGRVLQRADVDDCLTAADRATIPADALVVERTGVDSRSLTFANRERTRVYACDGGIDAAGERAPPWCSAVFGEVVDGRVLDPRLDVVCRDRARRPLAYAFVEPVAGARWIGVREGGYVELYEVLAGLPVRVAGTRGVDLENARATFEVAQYDAEGHELVHGALEAAVAG
jgi:hypothetical protein